MQNSNSTGAYGGKRFMKYELKLHQRGVCRGHGVRSRIFRANGRALCAQHQLYRQRFALSSDGERHHRAFFLAYVRAERAKALKHQRLAHGRQTM